MKRLTMLSLLVLTMAFTASAQDTGKFRFGLHASPILSWMKPDSKGYESAGSLFRFSYGLSAEFTIENVYSFATGIDILSAGGKLQYAHQRLVKTDDKEETTGINTRTYKIQYLQVPATIKMRSNEIGYLTFFGQFGIGNSFKLNAKADDEFSYDGGVLNEEKIDIKNDVAFYRASLMVGGGIEYSLGGSTALTAGILYNNGFTDVLTGNNTVDETLNENSTMNYIEFKIGVIF